MKNIPDEPRPTVIIQGSGNFVLVKYQAYGAVESETVAFRLFEPWPRPPRWFGRNKEISELSALIMKRTHRMIGILGPGGIGKSSLMAKLLEKLGASGYEVDAIVWRDVANHTNYQLFLDGLIRDLGQNIISVNDLRHLDDGEKIDFLLNILSHCRALIIFDGLEALFESAGERVGRCSDPRFEVLFSRLTTVAHQSQIIFTSREAPYFLPLQTSDYQSYYLGGLTRNAALQMLTACKVEGDETLLADIARQVKGSPFALEHIAALIHDDFGGDAHAFSKGSQRIPERLEDLIAEQLNRADPVERDMIIRASIYRYPISEKAFGALVDVSAKSLWRHLSNLRRRQLLNYEPERQVYSIHPLIRGLATEQIKDFVELHSKAFQYFFGAALEGHAVDHFIVAGQIAPNTGTAMVIERRTGPSQLSPNETVINAVKEAHYHACQAQRFDDAFRSLFHTGYISAQMEWVRRGFSVGSDETYLYQDLLPDNWQSGERLLTNDEYQFALLKTLGDMWTMSGELDQAEAAYQQSIELLNQTGNNDKIPLALVSLADVYGAKGENEKGVAALERALSLVKEGEQNEVRAPALCILANIRRSEGDLAASRELYKQSIRAAIAIKNFELINLILRILAYLYKEMEDIALALVCFRLSDRHGFISTGHCNHAHVFSILYGLGPKAFSILFAISRDWLKVIESATGLEEKDFSTFQELSKESFIPYFTADDLKYIQETTLQKHFEHDDIKIRAKAWYLLIEHSIQANLSDTLSDKVGFLAGLARETSLTELFNLGVDAIILAGHSKSEDVRRAASLHAHSLLSNKLSVDILLVKIQSHDPYARYIAAWGLKWTVQDRAIGPLLDTISDKQEFVAEAAMTSLMDFEPENVILLIGQRIASSVGVEHGKYAVLLEALNKKRQSEALNTDEFLDEVQSLNQIVVEESSLMSTKNDDSKPTSPTEASQTRSVNVGGNVFGSVIVTGDFNTVTAHIRMSQVPHAKELADYMEQFKKGLEETDPSLKRAEWQEVDTTLQKVGEELAKPEAERKTEYIATGFKRINDILIGAGVVMKDMLVLAEPIKKIADLIGLAINSVF